MRFPLTTPDIHRLPPASRRKFRAPRLTQFLCCVALTLSGATARHAQAQKPSQSFTIGVSNTSISPLRLEMMADIEQTHREFAQRGVAKNLVVSSANTDVQGQIGQIRNLINKGVDGIMVNAASPTALNSVVKEAIDAGITVVSWDNEVTVPKVINVTYDQAEWARVSARWLVDALGGKGNVIVINGIAGYAVSEARYAVVKEVFAKAPGIKVVNVANGDWDETKAQQVMSNLLAAQPNLDGVWVSGAMSEGVLRALAAANLPKLPIITGDNTAGYLRLWKEVKGQHPEFKSYIQPDPPCPMASGGYRVLVNLLSGKKLKDDALKGGKLFVPLPEGIDESKLDGLLERHAKQPNSYYLDSCPPAEQIDGFFR